MDVGGGLGVDYEGTRSRSFCSINYGLDQYAANIVQPLAEACAEHGLTPPMVLTESGRALTAHHAVLVANVSEVERAPEGSVPAMGADEPLPIGGKRHGKLDDAETFLLAFVGRTPDVTMPELAAALQEVKGIRAAPQSLSRWLIKKGFSFKKNTSGRRTRQA